MRRNAFPFAPTCQGLSECRRPPSLKKVKEERSCAPVDMADVVRPSAEDLPVGNALTLVSESHCRNCESVARDQKGIFTRHRVGQGVISANAGQHFVRMPPEFSARCEGS